MMTSATKTADLLELAELRDRLETTDIELPSFTTEELRVSSPSPLADRYVAAPPQDPSDEDRATARQAATSLTARGFLASAGEGKVTVKGSLALVAATRLRPIHFATVTGLDPDDRVFLWRLGGTDIVLHERVSGGVHRFVLRSVGRAAAALAAMAMPPSGGEDAVEVLDREAADAVVPEATERYRIESLTSGAPGPAYGHLTLMTHETGTLVVSADVSKDTPTAAVTRATSPSALATLLATWLREPDSPSGRTSAPDTPENLDDAV